MNQRISSSQIKPRQILDHSKHQQILASMKTCIQYITQIFRHCHFIIKPFQQSSNLIQHCHYVQKMVKKLVNLIPKNTVLLEVHNKFMQEYDQMKDKYHTMLKDERDYKCQLDVLEKKLAEIEKREQLLMEQRQKQKQITNAFQKKMQEARKQSQTKFERHIYNANGIQSPFQSRKRSLPLIITNSTKTSKVLARNSIHSIGDNQIKTHRLVEHLRKKY